MPRGSKAVMLKAAAAGLIRQDCCAGRGQALTRWRSGGFGLREPRAPRLDIAGAPRTCRQTVASWRRRIAGHRQEGLADAPRPGAPRTIGDQAGPRKTSDQLPPGVPWITGPATPWARSWQGSGLCARHHIGKLYRARMHRQELIYKPLILASFHRWHTICCPYFI